MEDEGFRSASSYVDAEHSHEQNFKAAGKETRFNEAKSTFEKRESLPETMRESFCNLQASVFRKVRFNFHSFIPFILYATALKMFFP